MVEIREEVEEGWERRTGEKACTMGKKWHVITFFPLQFLSSSSCHDVLIMAASPPPPPPSGPSDDRDPAVQSDASAAFDYGALMARMEELERAEEKDEDKTQSRVGERHAEV